MGRRRWLRAVFYVNLLVVIAVVGYKLYIDVIEPEYETTHARQVEAIQDRLEGRESFRFAVVGNINNSIGVFERQIVPLLNASRADFVVSAGNAVSDGGEDKYRALGGTLSRLEIPYLVTFGENEAAGFGSARYYRHFGPYFFAFTAGDSRFIFLDGTGETSAAWQLRWLEEELADGNPGNTFLFTGRPIRAPDREPLFVDGQDFLEPPSFRRRLIELIDRHEVDGVFAANLPLYDHQVVDGTHYVTTGGAGGLVVSDEVGYHHFVTVTVSGDDRVSLQAHRLDVGQHPVFRALESLWLFVHSLFFVGYLNFLLLLSGLIAVGVKLHGLVFVEKDYYPSFDVDPAPYVDAPLRVAMFTNNYLPFIGGVPVSIARLARGLSALGKEILVVAPRYDGEDGDGGEAAERTDLVRVPSILSFGEDDAFRLANIFHPGTVKKVRAFGPDVIHLHHPFWLGSLGLWLARRLGVPAVYTYHTRFEHYAHYVPVPGRLFRNLISHYLIRRFANKCFGVVVPTVAAREYLRTIGVKSRVVVQPTGVDREAFERVDPADVEALRRELGIADEPVLVSVSRLGEEKNIDFLIEGVASLAHRLDTPFTFVLVGEGDERERLEAWIEELGLENTILLPGAVPAERMPTCYHLGDLFLFASTTETQGMVVLEAMASGLPVVAVRSSGIDDFVQNGHNGYKTAEDLGEWTDRVERLMSDRELRTRLARNAREFARDHGIEPFAREIVEFYAEALAAYEAEGRES
jgi:glycosyltransferase involved in cell wall biosynthesis